MCTVLSRFTVRGRARRWASALYGGRLAGANDKVIGLLLLQHKSHAVDIVPGMAPVAFGVQISKQQTLLLARQERFVIITQLDFVMRQQCMMAIHKSMDRCSGTCWLIMSNTQVSHRVRCTFPAAMTLLEDTDVTP